MENKIDLSNVEYGAGLLSDSGYIPLKHNEIKEVKVIKAEKGIKYDKGKPRLCEMIQDFAGPLEEVAKVWAFGADKYSKGNWRYVEDGLDRYSNALVRHLLAEKDAELDLESGLRHAAHVAWNALARLYFLIEKEKKERG